MLNLLLLSSPSAPGRDLYEHAHEPIEQMFGGAEVLFVPYALSPWSRYTDAVATALSPWGVRVRGIDEEPDAAALVDTAEAIYVGGGNTFRLLRELRTRDLLERLRARIQAGVPYLGASAGTLITSPTICTTNDMPIVDPNGLEAMGVVPFQFNCHYDDPAGPSDFLGDETRDLRLWQFLEEQGPPVLALYEDSWVSVSGGRAAIDGSSGGKIFMTPYADATPVSPGTDVSYLLDAGATQAPPI